MRIVLFVLALAACERDYVVPIGPTGRWSTQLDLQHGGGLSAEIVEDQHVDGVAWLDLGSDGTARGEFGVHATDHWDESPRATPDHQDHTSGTETRELFALRGRWTSTATAISLSMEVSTAGSTELQHLQLSCTPDPAFARAPNATLTCIDQGTYPHGTGLGLGVALPDAMPVPTWHGGPVLIFGRAPGVHVHVGFDVGSVREPRVTLGLAVLHQADFVPTKNTEYRH